MQHLFSLLRHLLLLTAFMLILSNSAAYAATAHSRPNHSLCDEHCTGTDPRTSLCLIDAYPIYSYRKPVYDQSHTLLLIVENMFSPGCGTNWARITAVKGHQITGSITRFSDGVQYTNLYSNTMGLYWTPMVFSPAMSTLACATAPGTAAHAATLYSGCVIG